MQPFEAREIGLHLLRQLAQVAPFELAHAVFQLVQPLLRLRELHLEKLRGAGRLALPDPQVLLDVEGRQGVRDKGNRARIAALITDREGYGGLALAPYVDALQLQLDVIAHTHDDVFERDPFPRIGIEPEAVDQRLEPRAAQDLLGDRLKAGPEGARHGRLHEDLGDLLGLHDHGGCGTIDHRPESDAGYRERAARRECENAEPLAPAPRG